MKLFFCAIIFSVSIFSQQRDSIALKIIHYTFNNELNKASELIDRQIALHPKNPKFYLLKIAKDLRVARASTRHIQPWEKRKEEREKILTKLLEKNEILLEETLENVESKTLDNKFYIAGIYGYVGRTYGELGSFYSAFKFGKKGKKLLEEIIEEDSTYYDAYLGLGMFNYYADRLGGFIKFISTILGFSGDRELGLEYLKIAEEKGHLTKTEARVVLIDILTNMEQNIEASTPYFKRLIKQFPTNKNYINWYCNKMTDIDVYDDIKNIIENDTLNIISYYNKGRYYYENGNFEKSSQYFTTFLQMSPNTPFVHYMNEISKFLVHGNTNYDKENFPDNLKQRFIDITSSQKESKVAFNFRANANKGISSYIENNTSAQLQNTYLKQMKTFYLGVYHYNRNNFIKAIETFKSSDSIKYSKYSSYRYLLSCYLKYTVNSEQAENLISMIEEEDFEALEFRIRDLEKKYNL